MRNLLLSLLSILCVGLHAQDAVRSEKTALVMVHYGTTYDAPRQKTIDRLNDLARQRFPQMDMREAWTSRMIMKRLKAKGLRVDAIGMQSHNGLDYPNLAEYEKSIDAFAACGVKVMVTELDINVLPNPQQFGGADVSQNFEYQQKLNPYTNGLPKEKVKELDERWLALFDIYYRHRHQISRINLWGIADHNSWLNGWPIAGRTNYPLLFDRQYQPKAVVKEIVKRFAK